MGANQVTLAKPATRFHAGDASVPFLGGSVSEKPSYIGLLNAIAVGETQAECYLNAWAGMTPDDGVRQVLTTIALREGEHGKAFAKRMCELGYSVLERDQDKAAERLGIAESTSLTDREKFEKLGLNTLADDSKPDVFTAMFNDKTIDIQTGALLGRYIAEERDSGRMFQDCYSQLCAAEMGGTSDDGDLGASLGRIEQLLEQLVTKLA
jgi:hypothetical protein